MEWTLADDDDVRTACRGVGASDTTCDNGRRRFASIMVAKLDWLDDAGHRSRLLGARV